MELCGCRATDTGPQNREHLPGTRVEFLAAPTQNGVDGIPLGGAGTDAIELRGSGDRPRDGLLVGAILGYIGELAGRRQLEVELGGESAERCRLNLETVLFDEPAVDEPPQTLAHPILEALSGGVPAPLFGAHEVERRLQPVHRIVDITDLSEHDLGVEMCCEVVTPGVAAVGEP